MKNILLLILIYFFICLFLFCIQKKENIVLSSFYTNTLESNNLTNDLILVNKKYYLKKDFVPDDLVTVSNEYSKKKVRISEKALKNYIKMIDDLRKEGLNVDLISGYRSYTYQKNLYNNYVKQDGVLKADTYSARPGHSEHQTGLAFDLGKKGTYLKETDKEYEWILKNAYKYGFIIRYKKEFESITGYMFEPWHLRYVGKSSLDIYKKNITLEEYLKKI